MPWKPQGLERVARVEAPHRRAAAGGHRRDHARAAAGGVRSRRRRRRRGERHRRSRRSGGAGPALARRGRRLSGHAMNDRYVRQSVLPQVGAEGQARLARARVLVVGAGGLGCAVLPYLAAAGIGAAADRRSGRGGGNQPAPPAAVPHGRYRARQGGSRARCAAGPEPAGAGRGARAARDSRECCRTRRPRATSSWMPRTASR